MKGGTGEGFKKEKRPSNTFEIKHKIIHTIFFSTLCVRALKIVVYLSTSALFEISLHADIHRHEQQVLFHAQIEYSRDGNLYLNIPLKGVNKPTALTLHTCDRI